MAVDLLITSGNGPVECRIALVALLREIELEATRQDVAVETVRGPEPDRHGPKSAIVTLDGPNEDAVARAFVGTIRYIFKSPVRAGHKRQNWFVGVSGIEVPDIAAPQEISIADIRFETLRAGGPGGQHQNTTNSAVRATHLPTGLSVLARDERSQHRNKALAVARLAGLLAALRQSEAEARKAETFLTNRNLERGNALRTFRLDL